MIPAFLITAREGLEVALVVAVMAAVLRERGASRRFPLVMVGLAIGIVLSAASAQAMVSFLAQVLNEELFEGVLFFVTAAFVAGMAWWVGRSARRLKTQVADRLDQSGSMGWTLVAMTAVLVWREGTEMALMLRVAGGGQAWSTGVGIGGGAALASGLGWLLVKGAGGVPASALLKSSVWVLWGLVLMFVMAGSHELAEAGVLPFGKHEMAVIGPVVSRQAYVFAMLFLGWIGLMWHYRSRWVGARWVTVGVLTTVGVVGWFREVPAQGNYDVHHMVVQGDRLMIPAMFTESVTYFDFQIPGEDSVLKAMGVRQGDQWVAALDMCQICADPKGYEVQGDQVSCRLCRAEFSVSEVGKGLPGCQPAYVAGPFPADRPVEIPVAAFLEARRKAGSGDSW